LLRAGIRLKLFVTLLTALCAVVLAMVMLMQWSFDRGFRRYVTTMESERLERLAGELGEGYTAAGSWQFLRDDQLLWWQLLRRSSPVGEREAPRRARLERRLAERGGDPDLPPHTFEARSFLLDATHTPLAGKLPAVLPTLHPVVVAGQTVGYLGLVPHRKPGDARQLRFVQEQERAFLLIGLMLACSAALLSIPLARSLARRALRLAEGTHRLTAGEFESRIDDPSGDELGQLARNFNRLAMTLQQNESARRQWVADISHELRTPVAILRGEIEALRDGIRPATAAAHASLHAEALRLQRLIDDLHQLALADIDALSCHPVPVELNGLLQEVAATFAPAFDERKLTLTTDLPEPPLTIQGDAVRLRQLLGNLLENSLKYTNPGGRTVVALRAAANRAVLTVDDSAPAVPMQALPHLFDRLYRADGSRSRESGGAGLGLAICRTIVTAHGGEITARLSPLGGVCIDVKLPLAEER